MKVLITCDDGIESIGLKTIVRTLSQIFEIVVVAPDREKSTSSHALTLHRPLRIIQKGDNEYAVNGTPADCVYSGIRLLGRPDLVVSGINIGANLGTDIFYSGTVAGAREAAFMNIKSYAFSVTCNPFTIKPQKELDTVLEGSTQFVTKIIEKTKDVEFSPYSLLNVNIPYLESSLIKGIKVTTQAIRLYDSQLTKRNDPFGRDYYWIGGGKVLGFEGSKENDCALIQEGFVTVTPLTVDCTNEGFLKKIKNVF